MSCQYDSFLAAASTAWWADDEDDVINLKWPKVEQSKDPAVFFQSGRSIIVLLLTIRPALQETEMASRWSPLCFANFLAEYQVRSGRFRGQHLQYLSQASQLKEFPASVSVIKCCLDRVDM
jgi:hypothetical protein